MAPAACYAQNLVATDGEVTEAATADACPLTSFDGMDAPASRMMFSWML